MTTPFSRPDVSQAFKDANPHLFGGAAAACGVGEPWVRHPQKSPLAVQFENTWENIGGQPFVEEFEFAPDRRFRADYAFLDADTGRILALVELEGITKQGGRHQRKEGFERDVDKYFIAQVQMNIPVIRLTRKILKQPENLVLVRQFIEKQRTQNDPCTKKPANSAVR